MPQVIFAETVAYHICGRHPGKGFAVHVPEQFQYQHCTLAEASENELAAPVAGTDIPVEELAYFLRNLLIHRLEVFPVKLYALEGILVVIRGNEVEVSPGDVCVHVVELLLEVHPVRVVEGGNVLRTAFGVGGGKDVG